MESAKDNLIVSFTDSPRLPKYEVRVNGNVVVLRTVVKIDDSPNGLGYLYNFGWIEE